MFKIGRAYAVLAATISAFAGSANAAVFVLASSDTSVPKDIYNSQQSRIANTECNGVSCDPGLTNPTHYEHAPTAVSASTSSNQTGDLYVVRNGIASTRPIHAEADAYADLRTGQLHAGAAADFSEGFARAQAMFGDELTFTSLSADPFEVIAKFHIDGTLKDRSYAQIAAQFGYEHILSRYDVPGSHLGQGNFVDPFYTSNADLRIISKTANFFLTSQEDFYARLLVTPNTLVNIRMELTAEGVSSDLRHTASVSFVLPEGVSFRSASAVFLSDPGAGAVPEPSIWAMMLMGFGGMGAMIRRRRCAIET